MCVSHKMFAHVPFRWVHAEPSIHLRKANMEQSMHFFKANTQPSINFKRDNAEILAWKCQSSILTNLSANWAICRQVQARTYVWMHLVKAYVMTHHTVNHQNNYKKMWHICMNWSVQHYESFIYNARYSAIWQWKVRTYLEESNTAAWQPYTYRPPWCWTPD